MQKITKGCWWMMNGKKVGKEPRRDKRRFYISFEN
jgi:hypothetical protein